MTTELEKECREWFYEIAFVPANPALIAMPYGYDMNYIKSLREIIGKYIKEDFDIVKGYGDFGIEIRLKEMTE